ncbi:MAG: hypothetical protein ACE5KZ_16850 [Candidatus Scalinduaceae bacterium]
MNSKKGAIKVSETQLQELIEKISIQLYHYQIGLVKLKRTNSSEDAIPAGSGTLVEIDGLYAILTAQHVIKELPKSGDIGLMISPDIEKPIVKSEFLNKIEVARGSIESEGPDLGIILLPSPIVGQLKAKKSFYNLSLKRDKILSDPPKNYKGIWFLCGMPAEMTTTEGPSKGFNVIKRFTLFCGAARVKKEYSKGEYDYFVVDAHYNETNQLPESFGGISGGGLWQVILKQQKGKVEAEEMILSGVVFYQSPLSNNIRLLKCHGRRSIYKNTFDVVKKCDSS